MERLNIAWAKSSLTANAKSSPLPKKTLATEFELGGPDGFPPGKSIIIAKVWDAGKVFSCKNITLAGSGVLDGSKLEESELVIALLIAPN
jgi:hypothetical protein